MSKGFTLIEVLAASFVICVFAASFTFLVSSGIGQIKASRQLTRSVFISKSMLEELRSRPFDALYSFNDAKFDNGAGVINVAPAGNGLASITIRHKNIEFNTLRSRN